MCRVDVPKGDNWMWEMELKFHLAEFTAVILLGNWIKKLSSNPKAYEN
jgi:hypothetical protein